MSYNYDRKSKFGLFNIIMITFLKNAFLRQRRGFEGPMTSDEKEGNFRGEEKLHYD